MHATTVNALDATRRFHRLTSYARDRHWLVPAEDPAVIHDFVPSDPTSEPSTTKSYLRLLPRHALPPPRRAEQPVPVTHLLGGAVPVPAEGPLTVDDLAAMLRLSTGTRRPGARGGGDGSRRAPRAAASAGGRHPVELYPVTVGVAGLPDATWHWDWQGDQLVRLGPPSASGTCVAVTVAPWRSEWRYAERGYRYALWDAGTVAQHLLVAAASRARPAALRTSFCDGDLALALGLDGLAEAPVAVVDLAGPVTAPGPTWRPGPVARGNLGPVAVRFPLAEDAHAAAGIADWPAARQWARCAAASPVVVSPPAAAHDLDDIVARRRARHDFAEQSVDAATVRWLAALTAFGLPWDAAVAPDRVDVLAHRVDGLVEGRHVVAGGSWRVARPGGVADDAARLALGQQAAARAAAVLVPVSDVDAVLADRGPRGHRALHLAAGAALARVQLAATACGWGCVPLTVHDEHAAEVLGAWAPLALAVGVTSR